MAMGETPSVHVNKLGFIMGYYQFNWYAMCVSIPASCLTNIPRSSGPQEVLVTGSFNGWKEPTKLSKNNDGSFSETLALPFSKICFKVRITIFTPVYLQPPSLCLSVMVLLLKKLSNGNKMLWRPYCSFSRKSQKTWGFKGLLFKADQLQESKPGCDRARKISSSVQPCWFSLSKDNSHC